MRESMDPCQAWKLLRLTNWWRGDDLGRGEDLMERENKEVSDADLRAEIERQAEEIASLRAAVGHLINGITAAGMLSFDFPKLTGLAMMTETKNALWKEDPAHAKMLEERKELEAKVRQHSEKLDAAIKAAGYYVWDDDGTFKD